MNAPRSDRLTEEQWPEAVRYVGAIFLSGAALWMLLTLRMLISPPSNADLCGDEAAMCCRLCAAFAWFTILPFAALFFALIFFLPGFVTVRSIARSVGWWRPAYWIPGWVVTGVIAAALLAVVFAATDRKIIALNIHNGILRRRAMESVELMIGLGFFGLLCGICYWLMRDKRSANRESVNHQPSGRARTQRTAVGGAADASRTGPISDALNVRSENVAAEGREPPPGGAEPPGAGYAPGAQPGEVEPHPPAGAQRPSGGEAVAEGAGAPPEPRAGAGAVKPAPMRRLRRARSSWPT
jgi:hypothetical protein